MCIIYTVKRTPCRVDLKPIGHKLSWCGNQYHEFQYLYKCITFLGGLRDTLNPFNSKLMTLILRGGLWTFSLNLALFAPPLSTVTPGRKPSLSRLHAVLHTYMYMRPTGEIQATFLALYLKFVNTELGQSSSEKTFGIHNTCRLPHHDSLCPLDLKSTLK